VRRRAACAKLKREALRITKRRGLRLHDWQIVQETPSVRMDPAMTRILRGAAGRAVPSLPSGAGHDAAVMARACPAAMLFVRCKGGVSHHPEESVEISDVAAALDALTLAVLELAKQHA
jgi:allantoate deiminase